MISKKSNLGTKQLIRGRIYVLATFNNTLVTVTDMEGNTVVWGSSGASGFKGARKATPYAATTTAEYIIKKAKLLGLSEVEVFIKGPGPGRDAVLRYLRNSGLKVTMIADVTPISHNGCRPRKRRRI